MPNSNLRVVICQLQYIAIISSPNITDSVRVVILKKKYFNICIKLSAQNTDAITELLN